MIGSEVLELGKVFLTHRPAVFFPVFLQLGILADKEAELSIAADLFEPAEIVPVQAVVLFQFFAQFLFAAVGVDGEDIIDACPFHAGRPLGIGGFRRLFPRQQCVVIGVDEVVVGIKVFLRKGIVRQRDLEEAVVKIVRTPVRRALVIPVLLGRYKVEAEFRFVMYERIGLFRAAPLRQDGRADGCQQQNGQQKTQHFFHSFTSCSFLPNHYIRNHGKEKEALQEPLSRVPSQRACS